RAASDLTDWPGQEPADVVGPLPTDCRMFPPVHEVIIQTAGQTPERRGRMHVGPLLIGLVAAMLCYLSLVETVGRGSAAAVVIYHRRAIATSVAVGLVGALAAVVVAALG